jgi:hypothetical protein
LATQREENLLDNERFKLSGQLSDDLVVQERVQLIEIRGEEIVSSISSGQLRLIQLLLLGRGGVQLALKCLLGGMAVVQVQRIPDFDYLFDDALKVIF